MTAMYSHHQDLWVAAGPAQVSIVQRSESRTAFVPCSARSLALFRLQPDRCGSRASSARDV